MGRVSKELKELEKKHSVGYMLLDRLKSDVLFHLGWGDRNLSEDRLLYIFKDMYRLWDLLPIKPKWLSREQIDILRYLSMGCVEGRIESGRFSKNGKFIDFELYTGEDRYGCWLFKKRRIRHEDIAHWLRSHSIDDV